MSLTMITISVVFMFLFCMVTIAYWSSRNSKPGVDGFIVGGRNTGTFVLLMSMGATYFSTWTLLGAFGQYYRSGVWFMGFTVWTILHAYFVWWCGTRIWLAGKKFNFVTPGQMMEHYYNSSSLRILFAMLGILALIPYMLIQVTGGAMALESLTDGAIPYVVGVSLTSLIVGVIVLWAGFKGTTWTDTFMGVFFGSILFYTLAFVIGKAGGWDIFYNVSTNHPDKLIVNGSSTLMIELWLGLGFGSWVLPHMWQKYYSARSSKVLGKVAALTPFWNSWLMAGVPLVVGVAANIDGLIPNVESKSDTILPLFFAEYAPVAGAFVVAGILAAAISTINSQILSAASLVSEDIVSKLPTRIGKNLNHTLLNRLVVAALTFLIFSLAMMPGASGYIIPVASLGFAIGLQMVPAAMGALHFKFISRLGALFGILCGISVVAFVAIFEPTYMFGPGLSGLLANIFVTVTVSAFTRGVPSTSVENYHLFFEKYLGSRELSELKDTRMNQRNINFNT